MQGHVTALHRPTHTDRRATYTVAVGKHWGAGRGPRPPRGCGGQGSTDEAGAWEPGHLRQRWG